MADAGRARPLVVTTFELPDEALRTLAGVAEVVGPVGWDERIAEATALVSLLTTRVDGALLASAPRLKVVANAVAGLDNVDLAACRERGIVVTNTPDVLTAATADVAIALMLSVTRRLPAAETSLRAGDFHGWRFWDYLGHELAGSTLGIFGMGRIGRAVARRARAFEMEIVYASRSALGGELEAELGARRVEMDELLRVSDIVSLHAPLTPETRHVIDESALRRMKPGSFLVNTARGPLVDEGALVDALRDGHLAGAGLDVFEREPEVHPGLLELPNVTLLPHIGSATVRTRTRMAVLAATNVAAVLSGRLPLTPVPG
jgi:glyoxylate reductase